MLSHTNVTVTLQSLPRAEVSIAFLLSCPGLTTPHRIYDVMVAPNLYGDILSSVLVTVSISHACSLIPFIAAK